MKKCCCILGETHNHNTIEGEMISISDVSPASIIPMEFIKGSACLCVGGEPLRSVTRRPDSAVLHAALLDQKPELYCVLLGPRLELEVACLELKYAGL